MPEKQDFERLWLAKFSNCLDEIAGEEIRKQVMQGSEGLSSRSSRQEVIAWSKAAMERLESLVDEEQSRRIMTGCACQYPKSGLQEARKTYEETGDVDLVHHMLQEQFESFLRNTLGLDGELVAEVVARGWGLAGVKQLLEICAEVEITFARAQVEAGADIIGLGDAISSQISPKMYREFALPYEQRIFKVVHDMGAIARLHICGDTSKIVDAMVESGADIIDLDWMVDMQAAADAFGDRVSFCGNFDPVAVMLHGSPEEVYEAARECMRIGGPRSFSAAGCEIPDGTLHENLHAQSRALRDA